MYVEDRAGLKIRSALEGVKRKKMKAGEEEDESESAG
jgi:hypothetical protein